MIKEKCIRCGYSEFKNTLTEHHLDGNHNNNDENNKIILCWNCHMSYHLELWILERIDIRTPQSYINPKRKKRKIITTQEEICEDIRTELNKVQLMTLNKESKI